MKNKDEEDYTYKCRSHHDIVCELLKDELIKISKLSDKIFDPDTGDYKQQDIAYKTLYSERAVDIEKAINADRERVYKNLFNIPLNNTVRISSHVLVQRVHMGLIYLHETYSNQGAASSVIHKTTTFVSLNTTY
jgi:hypothetical protein